MDIRGNKAKGTTEEAKTKKTINIIIAQYSLDSRRTKNKNRHFRMYILYKRRYQITILEQLTYPIVIKTC